MAEPFDALYQWLGIPPAEQPPHHYRLLGIQLYETSADVISHAADRQMTHVRTFQTGPRAALSQQILNQISAARVCLLDAVRKAAYDEQLRAQLTPRPEPVTVQSFPAMRPPRRKGRKWVLPVVLVGSLLITMVVAVLVYRNAPREDETVVARGQRQRNPNGPAKPAAEPSPPSQPRETTEPAKQDGPPAEPADDNDDNQPPEPEPPDIEPPAEPPPPDPMPETTHNADAEPKKLPVPNEATRSKTIQVVRDLFQDEYAAAKTREDKVSLAELLLKQADSLEDDPVARFVVLDEARKLAVEAGNQELALRAVRDVFESYAVDALAWKTQLLLDTAPAARTSDLKREHSTHALNLTEEAVEAERFEVAEKLVRLAKKLLQRSDDVELRKRALAVGKEVKKLQRKWARIIAARKTLAENPNDPAANLVLGQHLCLKEDDWPAGLPLLAKSSDPKLQAAAQQDLTDPINPATQTKAGDTWYALSQSDKTHQAFSTRAHHWYSLALTKAKGLARAKLEKRLNEITGSERSVRPATRFKNEHDPTGSPIRITAKLRATLIGHDQGSGSRILSLVFSPKGNMLASGSTDETIRLWTMPTGRERHALTGHTEDVISVAFSPDGNILASATWTAPLSY